MKASRLTVQRLLSRLPEPRKASLQDLAHAAAMVARGRLTPGPHPADLAERLERLEAWLTAASTTYTRNDPQPKNRSTT